MCLGYWLSITCLDRRLLLFNCSKYSGIPNNMSQKFNWLFHIIECIQYTYVGPHNYLKRHKQKQNKTKFNN